MLDIKGIDLSIDGTPILRSVDMRISAGRMIGLVGRNGAGKTSLMRTLMGLVRPSRGALRFNDSDLLAQPAYQRAHLGVGYMPEDRRLVPDLSARENILMPVWATGKTDFAGRLAWVYSLMPEVQELAERRAISISGGQQKLVALARALMVGTSLLLLDEPFEGVAPSLGKRLVEVIRSLRQEGLAVLLAESDYTHTHGVVDQTYVIDRGSVRAVDSRR